jgi:hypothetical protein
MRRGLSSPLESLVVLDSVSITISLIRVYLEARVETHRIDINSSASENAGWRIEARLNVMLERRGRRT